MNLISKIMNLFNYKNIEEIKIRETFKTTKPHYSKMNRSRNFFQRYNCFRTPIVLNHKDCLIDGYTSYLVAKENNLKWVKIVRAK